MSSFFFLSSSACSSASLIIFSISSGVRPEEIEKIIKEAEEHAEEDRKKKELIEAKNQLDHLVYQLEKTIKEAGEKIPSDVKQEAEKAIEEAKKAIETATDIEQVRRITDRVLQVSSKLGTTLYGEAGKSAGSEKKGREDDGEVEAKPVD